MAGIFGEFSVSVSHKTKHENSSKISGKISRENSGQNSGQKFGDLSLCNFSRESLYGGSLKWGLKATLCNLRTIIYSCALLWPFWAPFVRKMTTIVGNRSNSSRGFRSIGSLPPKTLGKSRGPRRTTQRPRRTLAETPQSPLRDPRRASERQISLGEPRGGLCPSDGDPPEL